MELELGSIAVYCLGIKPMKDYTRQLPQDFVRPSMYFPAPTTNLTPDFIGGYKHSAIINIKFFDVQTVDAVESAQTIADSISNNMLLVPMLNFDGTRGQGYVRIESVDVRAVDQGIGQLSIRWCSLYKYTEQTYTLVQHIISTMGVK